MAKVSYVSNAKVGLARPENPITHKRHIESGETALVGAPDKSGSVAAQFDRHGHNHWLGWWQYDEAAFEAIEAAEAEEAKPSRKKAKKND